MLVAEGIGAIVVEPAGAAEPCTAEEALERLAAAPHVVCHAVHLIERLVHAADQGKAHPAAYGQRHFDVAELFTFARPAVMATPTVKGFAAAMGLASEGDEVALMPRVVAALLRRPGQPASHRPARDA